MAWNEQAQDSVQWQPLVNTLINPQVPMEVPETGFSISLYHSDLILHVQGWAGVTVPSVVTFMSVFLHWGTCGWLI